MVGHYYNVYVANAKEDFGSYEDFFYTHLALPSGYDSLGTLLPTFAFF